MTNDVPFLNVGLYLRDTTQPGWGLATSWGASGVAFLRESLAGPWVESGKLNHFGNLKPGTVVTLAYSNSDRVGAISAYNGYEVVGDKGVRSRPFTIDLRKFPIQPQWARRRYLGNQLVHIVVEKGVNIRDLQRGTGLYSSVKLYTRSPIALSQALKNPAMLFGLYGLFAVTTGIYCQAKTGKSVTAHFLSAIGCHEGFIPYIEFGLGAYLAWLGGPAALTLFSGVFLAGAAANALSK